MDKLLRFIFTILMAINFLLIGPIMVGTPVLADQRLPEGATAFGQHRIGTHRTGCFRSNQQMEPDHVICDTRRAGLANHPLDVVPSGIPRL
ncbi:MAG TPA: hypothetical protein VFR47_24725 [Anaerolineales bacterium]|nr:hypothetical protein [Anaerolineales bacterium]